MRDGEPVTERSFGLLYDLRNPPFAGRSFEAFYSQVFEQIRWAEEIGIDSAWLAEHHFSEDGYTPSPLVILSAIAAQTTRLRLGTALMVPAFHNPIRLAEDAATLSIISNGRFDLGMGQGYREEDFAAFGQRVVNRVSILEETVEVLRRAMSGRSLAFEAKRFYLPGMTVTPVPARPPRIFLGAERQASVERVARIGDGLLLGSNADLCEPYLRALADLGKDPDDAYISIVFRAILAEDPEKLWAEIGDFALYSMNTYVTWGAFPGRTAGFSHRDELLELGWFSLMDASMAAEHIAKLLRDHPQIRDVRYLLTMPGESVESSSARLEYYVDHVVSRVRKGLAARNTA